MPMNKDDYPCNWKAISLAVRKAADNKCELCPAENGQPHWKTGSKVVLTVRHIDGNKQNNYYKGKLSKNLIALCQRDHLRLDAQKHIENSAKSRQAALKGEKGKPIN